MYLQSGKSTLFWSSIYHIKLQSPEKSPCMRCLISDEGSIGECLWWGKEVEGGWLIELIEAGCNYYNPTAPGGYNTQSVSRLTVSFLVHNVITGLFGCELIAFFLFFFGGENPAWPGWTLTLSLCLSQLLLVLKIIFSTRRNGRVSGASWGKS